MKLGIRYQTILLSVVLAGVFVGAWGCRDRTSGVDEATRHLVFGMERYYQDPKYSRITGPASGSDRILARVNGEAIRREQLDERLVGIIDLRVEEGQPTDPATMDKIRARLLDSLISLTVERQEAIRIAPDVSEEDIAAFVRSLEEDLGGADALKREIKEAGLSDEEFHKMCEQEAQVLKLRETIFGDEVPEPTEQEIDEYYRNVAWPAWYNVRARSIFIEAPLSLPPIERRQKRDLIEDLRARAAAGGDFAALAEEYSDDENTRDAGGDNGIATLSKLIPPIRRALKDLAIGAVSDIVDINTPPGKEGYAIFKVTDIQRRPPTDPQVRHVLAEEIKGGERQKRYRQWLVEKRTESRIVILDNKIRGLLGLE